MTGPAAERKLTVEELDRFLELPIDRDEVRPYHDAAAVLAGFDPFELRPFGGTSEPAVRDQALGDLLPLCEPVTQGPERGLWSLTLPMRRTALERLKSRRRMKQALEANSKRPDTPVQRMFENIVDAAPIELADLSREDLAALATVHGWVADILDGLPELAAIRLAIARSDLFAPMRRLTGNTFVGRDRELNQLEAYVASPSQTPLFVFGPGGVGKSTLLAQFILTRLAPNDTAIAYVDIDRPTIEPDRPLTLVLEAIAQLQAQLETSPGSAESLTKEIAFTLARQDQTRQLESVVSTQPTWIFDAFRNWLSPHLAGRAAVILVDTVEEAQFLGSDVMWGLTSCLFDLAKSDPRVRVILSGRAVPDEYIQAAFPHYSAPDPEKDVDDAHRYDEIPIPDRPINLGVLDEASAHELLRLSVKEAKLEPLTEAERNDVIGVVTRNPMCLKLAARLLADGGIEKLRMAPTEMLAKLKAEKIQAHLYGRILRHIRGEAAKKVAYPGLVVRRIDAEVIRHVLAGPCELELVDAQSANAVVEELRKEAALVEVDPADGSLRHRPDVRRLMLEDLLDHVDESVVEAIDRAAVDFYKDLPGDIARAEEIYHRMRLRESDATLDALWTTGAGTRLRGALTEVPAEQQVWLAGRLDVTLLPSVRETASQEAWEDQAARSAERYLTSGKADKALSVLHERTERLPRSRLFRLEAEAYHFLGRFDDAFRVARAGVESASKAGGIDLALELLLKIVVIEEGRGNVVEAEQTLKEAGAVAAHSANDVLRLRVKVTALRLQRQLRPADRAEREALRKDVLTTLTDDTVLKLRDQPVLLREVAAELAKQDARVASAAIQTLGIEVTTDEQARALGRAIATLSLTEEKDVKSGGGLEEVAKRFQKAKFDPKVIRKWVTEESTRADTRRLGNALSSAKPGAKELSGFREYFRVGVDKSLRGGQRVSFD